MTDAPPPDRTPTGAPIPRTLTWLAVLGAAFLLVPLVGLLVRVPWSTLLATLSSPAAREALGLSLLCATTAAALCVVLGVPLAAVLVRARPRTARVLRALVTVPLVLPPVVGGVALLATFGRRGLLGQYLDAWFGLSLPFTTAGVVVAEAFVAMPFLVLAAEGALRGVDPRLDQAAATLGASRWYRFRRVTLPVALPGLAAGAVLAWARALGEFGATVTFAGSFPGTTRTLPLAVYVALESDPAEALALAVLLMVLSVVVLVALRGRWLGVAR